MKRELKFRSFVKHKDGTIQTVIYHPFFEHVDNEEAEKCITNGEIIIGSEMEFTGLTDKNDKDIYEGDVVLSAHPNEYNKYKCDDLIMDTLLNHRILVFEP